jgi:phosphoribosylglycinamide formyltransferase 1
VDEYPMTKLAIFLSGAGSNARNLCGYFAGHPKIEIALLLSNNPNSGVASIASDFDIPFVVFNQDDFYRTNAVIEHLIDNQIDAIVLAGFLWLVPPSLIERFPGKIINIHPALLPKYGGKGMYGAKIHAAVHQNREAESGITIHVCDEAYDEGDILFQATCKIEAHDTPATIAQKVYALEYEFFPKVVEEYLGG